MPDDYEKLQELISYVKQNELEQGVSHERSLILHMARILGRLMAETVGAQKPNFGGGSETPSA